MAAHGADGAPDLGERFVLTELLGKGSFGRVYRAVDRRYGLDVALKVLSGFHSEALRLFKAEFRALAHVSHPNLVTLYELHAHGEAWFYTMEHVPGVTLSTWARAEPRPTAAIRDALLQMGAGVAALHEAGLLHRDLKPANVLVTPGGRIAVGDFGHVGTLDRAMGATADRVIGTVSYSAPEIWLRTPVGPAADWYAFGVGMFELLTGRRPYDGVGTRTQADGPRPSTVSEGVPADLDALCGRLLSLDPAMRPHADEVLAVLRGEASAGAVWTSAARPFVGRAAELEALEQALARARTEGSALHLVVGPSGIGKTSLTEELARRAQARGTLVLRGRSHPQDALMARGLDGVVDALGRHVAKAPAPLRARLVPGDEPALRRMFPTLSDVLPRSVERETPGTTSKEARQAALAALARIFQRVAAEQPVLVLVDDLHWADAETGSALLALLEALREAPGVLVVGTCRDDHAASSPALRMIEGGGITPTTLSLGALGAGDAEALVRAVLGSESEGARLEAVLAAAQGNPYLLAELASHLRQGSAPPPGIAEDALVDRVVLSRVSQLAPTARRVLEVLTLAEIPLPANVVIGAAELADADYLGDLTTLRASRLVTPRLAEREESLEPYHGRVREAVARSIPAPARPALHRAIARAFERAAAPAREVIARHYFEAGEMGLALEHARAAAEEARASLAFGRAIAMLELAERTGAAGAAEARAIRAELADALANAGRGHEAADAFLSLVELDPEGAGAHERRAAEQLLFSGHIERGVEVLGRVLGRVGLALPRSRALSVARVLWAQAVGPGRRVLRGELGTGARDPSLHPRVDALNAATLGLTMTDPLASAVMQAEHLGDALRAGDPDRLARALGIQLVHTAGGWYAPERTARIRARMDELVRSDAAPQTVAEITLARAGAAWMEGRWLECLAEAERAMALLRRSSCVGMQWHIDTHHVMELEVLESLGRLDDIEARLGPYLGDARERGDRFLEATLRVRFRPTMLLAAGSPGAARTEIDDARRAWAVADFDLVALYGALRAVRCDLYAGEVEEARARMDGAWMQMQRSLLVRVAFYRDMARAARGACLLAWARAHTGAGRTNALREARRLEEALVTAGTPVTVAHARMLGAARLDVERRDGASAAYDAAAAAFDALGARLEAAGCRWRAAGGPERASAAAVPEATLADAGRFLSMLVP